MSEVMRCELCGEPIGQMLCGDPMEFTTNPNVALRCYACAATEAAEAITADASTGKREPS